MVPSAWVLCPLCGRRRPRYYIYMKVIYVFLALSTLLGSPAIAQEPADLYGFQTSLTKIKGRPLAKYEMCAASLFFQPGMYQRVRVHDGIPNTVQRITHPDLNNPIASLAQKKDMAITIGRSLYFPKGELLTNEPNGLQWLMHEMRHSQQYAKIGSRIKFVKAYVWYQMASAFPPADSRSYRNNPFEYDARSVDGAMQKVFYHPEFMAALASDDRDTAVCRLVARNRQRYQDDISASLIALRHTAVHFRFALDRDADVDFYVGPSVTKPVSGTVDIFVNPAKYRKLNSQAAK